MIGYFNIILTKYRLYIVCVKKANHDLTSVFVGCCKNFWKPLTYALLSQLATCTGIFEFRDLQVLQFRDYKFHASKDMEILPLTGRS